MGGKLTTGKLSYSISLVQFSHSVVSTPYKSSGLGILVAFEKRVYQVGLKTGVLVDHSPPRGNLHPTTDSQILVTSFIFTPK